MPARAGKRALVKIAGDPIAFVSEATTTTDFGIYQITNTARRILDPTATVTVLVGGVPTTEDYTLYRLTGTVAFAFINTSRGTVTISGSYLPLSTAAECKEYSYALSAQNVPDNAFGDTYVTRVQTRIDLTGSLGRWSLDRYFAGKLMDDEQVVLEFYSDAADARPDLGCWARISRAGMQSAISGLVDESVDFEATVDLDQHAIDAGTATDPVAPLALLLSFAPLARLSDRLAPAVYVPSGGLPGSVLGDGTTVTTPINLGALAPDAFVRSAYPRAADQWEERPPIQGAFANDNPPQTSNVTLTLLNAQSPIDNGSSYRVQFNAVGATIYHRNWLPIPPFTDDDTDVVTFRMFTVIYMRNRPGSALGTGQVSYFHAHHPANSDGGTEVIVDGPQAVVLTNTWKGFTLEWADPNNSHRTDLLHWLTIRSLAGGPQDIEVAFPFGFAFQRLGTDAEWARPLMYHDELGVLSQNTHENCWTNDCDDPTLSGGASKAGSAVLAPDNGLYVGGRTMYLYTLPNSEYLVAAGATTHQLITDVFPSNAPVRATWVGMWIKAGPGQSLPADGALKAYVQTASGGPLYGPVNLVRDTGRVRRASDGAAFYRARVPINTALGGTISGIVDNGDGTMTVTMSSAHTLVNGQHIDMDDLTENVVFTDKAVSGVTSTTFTFTGAVPTGQTGTIHPRYMDFTPRIQNGSGASLTFYGYRCHSVPENTRMWGWHQAWVPRRTLTGRRYNNMVDNVIKRMASLITMREGIWCARFVWPYSWGQVGRNYLNLRGGPGLWQGGPYGSADYNWDAALGVDATDGHPYFFVQMARGFPAVGTYDEWGAGIHWPTYDASLMPELVAFDICLAWKAGAIVAFGIGYGTGTAITWLNAGDSFLGSSPVTITSVTSATDWNIGDSSDNHVSMNADRDKTRFSGGYLQALACAGAGSVDPVSIKRQIERYIDDVWGARQDYR